MRTRDKNRLPLGKILHVYMFVTVVSVPGLSARRACLTLQLHRHVNYPINSSTSNRFRLDPARVESLPRYVHRAYLRYAFLQAYRVTPNVSSLTGNAGEILICWHSVSPGWAIHGLGAWETVVSLLHFTGERSHEYALYASPNRQRINRQWA